VIYPRLKLNYRIPPILNFAEIMPDFQVAKSVEIIDSCDFSEIVFIGMFVNLNKQ
jgi:hypothetical protein